MKEIAKLRDDLIALADAVGKGGDQRLFEMFLARLREEFEVIDSPYVRARITRDLADISVAVSVDCATATKSIGRLVLYLDRSVKGFKMSAPEVADAIEERRGAFEKHTPPPGANRD